MQKSCMKCAKLMDEGQFYLDSNGNRCEFCKKCLTMHIDNYNPETFLWILQKLDYPYVPTEWNVIRDRAFAKDPLKMTGMSVLGKYLSKMKLKQFAGTKWADTERLQNEQKERIEKAEQQQKILVENLKERLEAGEISEAEYKTITSTETQYHDMMDGNSPVSQGPQYPNFAIGPNGLPYGVSNANNPYIETEFMNPNDLPDIGADLTEEDKVALAMKWGISYRPSQWVQLEKMYNDFMESFTIQGAARIDTLKFICKTSLKMNEAMDSGDIDTYQKLSKVYDAQMKAAKFTEAQNKEEKKDTFDAVGCLVLLAEKLKGVIPRYDISTPRDSVDKTIQNLKEYNYNLITQDIGLAQQIENYLKQRAILEEQKARKKNGLDEITDEDIIKSREFEQEQRDKDRELFEGSDNE